MKLFLKQTIAHILIFVMNIVTLPITIIKLYNAVDVLINQWANNIVKINKITGDE